MTINAKYLAARAEEQRNRALTHLPLPAPFRLPLLSGAVLLVPQVHFTERMNIELIFAENQFVGEAAPDAADLFQVLWRMHPLFWRATDLSFPNLGRTPTLALRLASRLARRRLERAISRCALPLACFSLAERLKLISQDEPGEDAGTSTASGSVLPAVCLWDDLADYVSRKYGVAPQRALDLPRALIWQLHRNFLLSQPDGHMEVFDQSDRLLAKS